MRNTNPVIRPVDDEEAAKLSPWPARIAGTESWKRPERSGSDVDQEYDRGWYAKLLDRWSRFAQGVPPRRRHVDAVLRFLDRQRRDRHKAVKENEAVYGKVRLESFLVSAGDRLFAADVNLFEILWRSLIVEQAVSARAAHEFEAVVEIGCGDGINLFNLYSRLGLASIAGVERSSNAVRYLRQVVEDLDVNGTFQVGDFTDPSGLRASAPAGGPWALVSVHAIEQVRDLPEKWFEEVLSLPHPPVLAMHFEPLHWGDGDPFARACERYAELNGYNTSLVALARKAEANGTIRILQTRKRVLGVSAYNPTSVLMWGPA